MSVNSVSDESTSNMNVGLGQQVRDMQNQKSSEEITPYRKHTSYGPKQLGSFKIDDNVDQNKKEASQIDKENEKEELQLDIIKD